MVEKDAVNKFKYAGLAIHFLESGEEKYVLGAMDALTEDLGLSDDAKGFIEGAYSSEQGIQTALQIYGKHYGESFNKLTGNEIAKHYESTLKDFDEQNAKKIKSLLEKQTNNLEKITEESEKLSYAIKYGGLSEEEKENKLKSLEEFKTYSTLRKELDNYKMEELRSKAVKLSKKRFSIENTMNKIRKSN